MTTRLTTRLNRVAAAMGSASPGYVEVIIGQRGPAVRWGDQVEAFIPEPSAELTDTLKAADAGPITVLWYDHAAGVTSGDWLIGIPSEMTPEAAADVRDLLLDSTVSDRQREVIEASDHILLRRYYATSEADR